MNSELRAELSFALDSLEVNGEKITRLACHVLWRSGAARPKSRLSLRYVLYLAGIFLNVARSRTKYGVACGVIWRDKIVLLRQAGSLVVPL
jgi:hypothetical protein